jgi:hypothetical protein
LLLPLINTKNKYLFKLIYVLKLNILDNQLCFVE